MTGTFSGLSTALSALRYQQVALDVANNNVANVNTEGYVRRRAEGASVGATGQPAMWSQYAGHGDGVAVKSVTRLADPLLDARSRRENGTLSYLSTQKAVLNRVETSLNEPGDNGLSAALQELRGAFQDLVSDPAGSAARQTVLAKAGTVASAFHTQATSLDNEIGDQGKNVKTLVDQINDTAVQLANLNKTIKVAQVNHTDTGALSDQRDQLALTLAKLAGGVVDAQPDGQYNVSVNNIPLVALDSAKTMTATISATSSPSVVVSIDGTDVPAGTSGQLGGSLELLNNTLPTYKKALDAVATKFRDEMNAQHALGKDLDGAAGGKLFDFDAADPAGTLAVAFTDPRKIAASLGGVKDGGNADALSNATTAESDYSALVTSFGSSVAAINRKTSTQETLTGQVDDEREQMAGVSLDEETVNLVAAQHAFEAASKVMTVLDSLLDTLINRTGVTR